MKIAVYPGTFDPITYGHINIAERASHLFDEVIIAIAANVGKSPLFSLEERIGFIKQIFIKIPHIKVESFSGLLVKFMEKKHAKIVLRGIRTSGDMEYEFQLAVANRHLKPDIETVFLKPDERFTHISSSIVREIATMGGNLTPFVPPTVMTAFENKFKQKNK
jgi:pantetheine-phosphate adenylyltransferase